MKREDKRLQSAATTKASSADKGLAEYVKVTISIPRKDFEQIETICAQLKLTRSKLLVTSVRQWLANLQRTDLVKQYVKGYELYPENEQLTKVMEGIQAEALAEESW